MSIVRFRRRVPHPGAMPPKQEPFTLAPLVRRYLNGRLHRGELTYRASRDLASRLGTLERSFGYRPLPQLDRRAIEAWMEQTFPPLAPASRSAYLSTVKVFCRWLVAEGLLETDPTVCTKGVRRPRAVPRAQSSHAVAQLLAACRDDRERLIVRLMVGLGLRCCEVASARLADYDVDAAVLVVVGKNRDQRAIPVPDEVAAALSVYHHARLWELGPLVHRHRGPGPVTAATVSQIVTRLFWRAGLKQSSYDGRSAHALRHTCASDVLDRCHDIRVVQALLGHQQLATTEIYLRRADLGRLRDAMAGRTYAA